MNILSEGYSSFIVFKAIMSLERKMDFQGPSVIIINHFDMQTVNCDIFSTSFVSGKDREGIVIKMNHCK